MFSLWRCCASIVIVTRWLFAYAGLLVRSPLFAQNAGMSLKLFELVGTDASRPFSPFCWRTRMALAHKGLSAETIPWCFTEKGAIAPHGSEKVPVLLDADRAVVDSVSPSTNI